MSRLRRLLAAGAVSVALLLSGCGDPGPSDAEASLSAAQEQLYQDAFDIYAKYFELANAIDQQGGVEVLPDEIKQYVTGPQLAWFEKGATNAWHLGLYYTGTNVHQIESWQRGADPESGETDWFMSIEVCSYHEITDLMDAEGLVGDGGGTYLSVDQVQFARSTGDGIKVYQVGLEVVESCPF